MLIIGELIFWVGVIALAVMFPWLIAVYAVIIGLLIVVMVS